MNGVSDINFAQMPDSQSMVMYKDRIIVYDNINVPLEQTFTDEIREFLSCLPVKIDFTIVVMCLKGGLDLKCNLQEYSIAPGEVIVLVPGTIGEKLTIHPGSEVIVVTLSDDTFAPSGNLKKALYSKANFSRPFHFGIQEEMIPRVVSAYENFKQTLAETGTDLNDDIVSAYISVLSGFAAVNIEKWIEANGQTGSTGSSNKIFRDFLDSLARNYLEHRDVAFYAEESGLSTRYFSRTIFNSSGRHPLDWIKAHVILTAQAMLKRNDMSIREISEALNFSSPSAFNRYFKDETGMSPKDYK